MLGLFLGLASLIAPRATLDRAVLIGCGPRPPEPRPGVVPVPPPTLISCTWDEPRIELKALAPPRTVASLPTFGMIELDPPAVPPVVPPELAKRFMCLPRTSIDPEYPPSALRRRIQGEVLIDVSIDRSGSVWHADVLHADPAGVFERAALRAVRRWRYAESSCERSQVRLRFELPARSG